MVDFIMSTRMPQESTREYIYRSMKSNIMSFKLIPGTTISEQEFAEVLHASRTPVREAFIQLSQEGLLDIIPQKGTYVSLIDLESVEEAKFLRETLEVAIIEIACTDFPEDQLFELQSCITLQELCIKENNYVKFFELDEVLHETIFTGCKKARIWAMMQQMYGHYNRVRRLNIAVGYDLPLLLKHHNELVRAIREKDVALGMSITKLHLNKVKIDIKDLLNDYAHYFKQPQNKMLQEKFNKA